MPRLITALDIGSSGLTIAQFASSKTSGLELVDFTLAPVGLEPGSDADPSPYIVAALREMLRSMGIKPTRVLMSVSGKDIFPRYVKLPPVTRDKVSQIVRYEAQQNVPFPIEEVIWDYQLMDSPDGGQSVMLVAIKTEVVKALTDCVEAAGMEPEMVDVAPMALYNLARFNYGDKLDGSVMVMDIGARTTDLVFMEGTRVFCRSIPVAGNSITEAVAKEFEVPFKEAEELKLSYAYVALGGTSDAGDNPISSRVSKTARTVMTRLHAEVRRSINFYRSQQAGSKPSVVLLSGGTSVMGEADTFFREKLGVEVQYLNPFQGITLGAGVDQERVSQNLHLMSEVSGLALRNVFTCPMRINLMPRDLVRRKQLRAKIPFFAASLLGVVIIMICWWGYFRRVNVLREKNLALLEAEQSTIDSTQSQLDALSVEMEAVEGDVDNLLDLVSMRTRWIDILKEVRKRLHDGMWISSMEPVSHMEKGRTVITHLRFSGRGFVDKVADAEAIGEFVNALADIEYFVVEGYEPVEEIKNPTEYSIEFRINMELREPMAF